MKRLIILIFSFLLLIILGGVWFFNGLMPLDSTNTLKRFVVAQGATASQIGSDLQKEGIIKNAIVFRIYSQVTQAARNIKPGSYELSSNLWTSQIINKLLAGPTEVWITVPEGLRREEVAQKFMDGFELTGKAATDFYSQFLELTANKEGYLFPDTYLFAKDANPKLIVKTMEDNFDSKYATLDAKNNELNKAQIVILASIIQREAITAEDMKGVSSVLRNRFFAGIALGSDVTLEYAIGYDANEKTWWKKDLTVDDLQLNSLYNTRLVLGFPPTPISNPGLVSLQTAIEPTQSDYLYYLSDKDGKLHFARMLEEHNANIAKYLN